MKNFIATALASVLLFGAATPAFASMTFIGDGYKVPPACTSNDHGVYEMVGGNTVVTGCWTQAAFDASEARARAAQVGIKFGVGTSLALKAGGAANCPDWFPQFAGCVIDKGLVR